MCRFAIEGREEDGTAYFACPVNKSVHFVSKDKVACPDGNTFCDADQGILTELVSDDSMQRANKGKASGARPVTLGVIGSRMRPSSHSH